MNTFKTLVFFVFLSSVGNNIVICQIPNLGTFSYDISIGDPNEPPNQFFAAISESQQVIYYNDSMIVTLQMSVFADQSYHYINKKNGNCTILERENGIYVQTTTKELSKAFDLLGLLNAMDTISYDTLSIEYMGTLCQKVTKKYEDPKSTYFIINSNLSYFSDSEMKEIYIPMVEYQNIEGYVYSKTVKQINTTFDHVVFELDTLGLKKIDLQTYVNQKMGFQIVSDSIYNSDSGQNNMFSMFSGYKRDKITKDTFHLVLDITRKFNDENLLDSIRNVKIIDPALFDYIQNNIKTQRIDEIVKYYFYNKILSTERGRKTFLENLDFAGIKLKNNASPLTLHKYLKEGYALDQMIAELKGYDRLIINLDELNYHDLINNIFKIVFPEYADQTLKVKVDKNNVEVYFNDNIYKLSLENINENIESQLHYKKAFISQGIRRLFTKMIVDSDLKRKVGIFDFSFIRNLFGPDFKIDTFFVYMYDKNTGIKKENLNIGLSFHDSLHVLHQLKLNYFYADENYGESSIPLNFESNKYLKTSQLKEFQSFYKKVVKNNKHISKMMQNVAANIPYELIDLDRIFAFFYEFYLNDDSFVPQVVVNTSYENNKVDTICNFNIAFPNIYNLLNQKLNIENIYIKKNNDWQYLVVFDFKGKNYKIVGTYEEIGKGCAKIIDQILSLDVKLKYRIYTSLEENEFYKRLIILRIDEVPLFEKASGISLTTLTP